MKISTKGKYAIKIMLDLATYDNGEPVSVRDIAKRQNISEKYLEQIIGVLNKASLVKSVRGPHGGYVLTDRPEKYTVGKILRAVEGDLSPTASRARIRAPASATSCGRGWTRPCRKYWKALPCRICRNGRRSCRRIIM